MKPEMEKLLQLFDEARQSREHELLFELRLDDLQAQYPSLSREQLRRIIRVAYLRWIRANSRLPTVPPTA